MTNAPPLQPTLWRTCRVLANRRRLQMFGLLVKQPDQTVTAVADRLKLSLPVVSQYLRALEARGLLTARRVGCRVYYRPSAGVATGPAKPLVDAMLLAFRRNTNPVESIYKLATAFTHPRRIEIYRALKDGHRPVDELKAATRISRYALRRHLGKLEARGFVSGQAGDYAVANPQDGFGRVLALLAKL